MAATTEPKIIFPEDPETATIETRTVWVSRTGSAHFDERGARWEGATHLHCEKCGTPVIKPYCLCQHCADQKEKERYERREKKKWDGKSLLYSESVDQFFEDMGEVEEYLLNETEDGNAMTLEDLRLMICDPVYARPLDDDYFCDEIPEDGEVPEKLRAAVDAFNEAIKNCGILSWAPGKYALDIEENEK